MSERIPLVNPYILIGRLLTSRETLELTAALIHRDTRYQDIRQGIQCAVDLVETAINAVVERVETK